ncbi:MAG: 50S ribosomal protein L6, partial [Chloroflexota bacterium]|nr:50S ribosomal protein L6 [Chloroflexota bacterium]
MSRIGNQPIELPEDVDIQIEGSGVTVKGPRGQLSNSFNSDISIEESDGVIKVSRPSDESEHKAFHGL